MRVERRSSAWLLAALLLLGGNEVGADGGLETVSHVSVYGAVYSPNRLIELVGISPEPVRVHESSGLLAIAAAREVRQRAAYRWEIEGQLVQHWGAQQHQELNAVLVARWTRFPWDRYVDTSVAFGQGVSYALRVPALEPRSDRDDEDSARLLNYLLVEIALGDPASDWSGFMRIHHRSGVFGLFSDVRGGSNFVGLGLRYRF